MPPVEMPSKFETKDDVTRGFTSMTSRFQQLEDEKRLLNPEDWTNLRKQVEDLVAGQKAVAEKLEKENRSAIWNGVTMQERVASLQFPYTPDAEFSETNRAYWNLVAFHPEELTYAAYMSRAIYPGLSPAIERHVRGATVDPFTRMVEEFQAINDVLLIVDAILYANGDSQYARSADTRTARMKRLKLWPAYARSHDFLRTAISNTTNVGAEWIPTLFSAQMHDLVQTQAIVAQQFPSMDMPSNPYKSPVLKSDGQVYLIPENTGDGTGTAITASNAQTTNMTLTAVKLAARMFTSTEATEDLIVPVIPFLLSQLAKVTGRGIDECVISADTASGNSHIDNPASGGPADAPSGTDDRRRAWVGLRAAIIQNSGMPSVDFGTTPTDASLLSLKGTMGVYGVTPQDACWITSIAGYMALMKITDGTNRLVMGNWQFGPDAVIHNGQLGALLGSPIIVSDYVPTDTDGTTMKRTAAGTKTIVLYAYKPAWQRGIRRMFTIGRSAERHIELDQLVFVSTTRQDFKPWYSIASGANKIVGALRNI